MKRAISILLSVILLLSAIPFSVNAETKSSIPADAVTFNGHKYFVFPNDTVSTWEAAKIYCENLGGYLAVISSSEENQFLNNYIHSLGIKSAYFGYTDSEKEGTWKWIGNEESTYSNWHWGEPNGEDSNEYYAEFYWKWTDGTWNDGNFKHGTDSDGNAFICEWKHVDNKAIVVVPGITGSELFCQKVSGGEGKAWCDISFSTWDTVTTIDGLIDQLKCDEYGNSRYYYYTKDETGSPYGTWDIYKDLVTSLQNSFDSDYGGNGSYDVRFFSYDWRLTNTIAADKLNDFIKEYEEVVLVCHSMGGIVGSLYMAKYGTSKIDKFISLGTPYYGAPKAVYTFETGRFLDDSGIKGWVESKLIKGLAPNIPGIYELIPTENYGSCITNSDTGESLNQKGILSKQSWFNEYIYDQSRNVLKQAEIAYSKIINGEVDSYVFVGNNITTITNVLYGIDGKYDLVSVGDGDGTVPLKSSTFNYAEMKRMPYYVNSVDHTGLAQNKTVISFINNIISGNSDDCGSQIIQQPRHPDAKKYTGWKVVAACPVSMSIYDNNNILVGTISENNLEFTDGYEHSFYYAGNNSEIKIAYLESDDYSIVIDGYDDGTMNLTVQQYSEDEIVDEKKYSSVPISASTHISFDITDDKIKVDSNNDGTTDYTRTGIIGLQCPITGYQSSRTVNYKTTILFHTNIEQNPKETTVHWFVNDKYVGEGESYSYSKATTSFEIRCKLVDNDGKTILAESEVERINVTDNIFQKIIAFFKNLFGIVDVIDQK